MPLLVLLCQEARDPGQRRSLAGLLYNLIKKPDAAQVRVSLLAVQPCLASCLANV